ncbi:MAG: sulfatase-like hydrolase/transferase [Verrucomicrobiae bacterium]|nr:sulfatase-like hydrolase/transferase [Verrucomicrobiae bacterium]
MNLPLQLACAAITLACGTSLVPSANAAATRGWPNILLLVSDDQRSDTIATLGNPHIRTPYLDRLVRQGVAFTRAICPNPLCVTSRAEILTGCTSFLNGVPYGGRLRPDMPTIAETFRQAGYHTWHVGKWHVHGEPKTRGYEETRALYSGGGKFENTLKRDHAGREVTGYRGWTIKTADGKPDLEKGVGLTAEISRHFADAAIEMLNRRTPEPFFLHVNFTAPHDPLIMPPGYAGRYDPAKIPLPPNFLPEHPFDHGNARGRDELLWPWPRTPQMVREELACYYAVISHMDGQIGRILNALRANSQADNTIIVFTSD